MVLRISPSDKSNPRAPRVHHPVCRIPSTHLPLGHGAPRQRTDRARPPGGPPGPLPVGTFPLGTPSRRAALSRRVFNHTRSNGTTTADGKEKFRHGSAHMARACYMSRLSSTFGLSRAGHTPFRISLGSPSPLAAMTGHASFKSYRSHIFPLLHIWCFDGTSGLL